MISHLVEFYKTWEALIHSIPISEVQGMKSHVFVGTWKNSKPKKTLKSHLEFSFNNFQERKYGKVLG